ncbi:AAA family ATPase [Desulfobacula phenolica]|uniref:ORC1/DEAH AAA+ ATPase domain-containing protein n=1 Tax=Desulfobacula phenolica TaxID=90732 RepID=A0A1H2H628_9BACT|nr:AAA family ATPase [Desulfobacula phenolica]SDU27266.1 hypothetical protein SAMN04487931_10664 [Desulfobacula phenolica]
MEKTVFNPVFVKTKNVRNFEVMMDALELNNDEGCFGMVYGQAGRGKSRTSQWYQAHNDCVYLRIMRVWRHSELEFLRELCSKAGVIEPPGRKAAAFASIIDALVKNPRPVFIDEVEKMKPGFIEIVRDLVDATGQIFVLLGEEELVPYMQRHRRVWSRTFQQQEFAPIEIADIIMYAKESTGLKLSIDVASMLHKASEGSWRPVKRALIGMVQYANSNETRTITVKTAQMIIKSALTGK